MSRATLVTLTTRTHRMASHHRSVALLALLFLAPAVPAQDPAFRPFDAAAFAAHAGTLGASEAQLAAFSADVADGLAASAADDLLRALVPPLDAAVTLAEDGDPRAVLELLALTQDQADLYLRAHARYHAGRALLDADDPVRATEILADFLRHDRNRTPFDSQAAFFYAKSLADTPKPAEAVAAYEAWLRSFPEAAERYRAVAQQRRAELMAQIGNPLHELADRMKTVERDLREAETGEPVQTEQVEIVTRLEKIIEQLEEQEKQSSGAPSGNTPSSAPASESKAPAGASSVGSLGDAPDVMDRWGAMKDRDREAIETEVQVRLKGRYRELVEAYYESLNKGRK